MSFNCISNSINIFQRCIMTSAVSVAMVTDLPSVPDQVEEARLVWMQFDVSLCSPSPSGQSGSAGRGGGADRGHRPRRRPPGQNQLLPVQRGKRASHPVQRHGRAGEPPRRPRLPAHPQRRQEQHLQEHRQVGPAKTLRETKELVVCSPSGREIFEIRCEKSGNSLNSMYLR